MIKKIISGILIGLITAFAVEAGNPDKQMVFHTAGDDMLVFIKPRKMEISADCPAIKPLQYDITLSTQTDSVAITCTIVTKNANLQTDSTLVNGYLKIPNERLYIEPKGKNWIYRLRYKMANEDFKQAFCNSPKVELCFDKCKFIIPAKKQPAESEICRTALTLIEKNKKQ